MAIRFIQFAPTIAVAIPGANPAYRGASIGSWDADKLGPGRPGSDGPVVEVEYDAQFVSLYPMVLGKRVDRIRVPMAHVSSIRESIDVVPAAAVKK